MAKKYKKGFISSNAIMVGSSLPVSFINPV